MEYVSRTVLLEFEPNQNGDETLDGDALDNSAGQDEGRAERTR